uniref:Uncharacterized protein n=1 Tax=Avena sativa TaxID=4498 RepID=A0ACD5TAY6_AVESA
MARPPLPKHPPSPTPSELGEMSAEQLALPVGAEAELRSDDPGFLGSFYEVTITGHLVSSGRYKVVYSTLVDDDGGPLEETAAAAAVRPRPPPSARGRGFALHEAVEALHNEGWWAGVVSAVPRPRVYEVAFPTSRERMEFQETALRPHRVFLAGRWVPAAEVVLGDGSPLFREGTEVEVSKSAKSFGESWSPASVLKVIGATNFLVQYMHIGSGGELATEILDVQYIRPAHTGRKYRFSRSSCVEVMHEGSWWPAVIHDILGSGIDKYVVKLKSHETDMDDVEFVDELTVENTQLRPRFHWNGKTWLRCLEEKSANVPTSASRKRSISYALSLQKEVSESSEEHGSYRENKLKNADVASEPIPPLWSVCNENCETKHKSSSYPRETVKQGNTVLAPPSLPPKAGFARLSHSSFAQSSHLEQASSRKTIIPSAPAAPKSQQLQALLFGTFGQPRTLPHALEQASSQKTIIPSAQSAHESRQLQASLFGTFGQPRTLPQGPFSAKRSLTPDFGRVAGVGFSTDHSRETAERGPAMVQCTSESNLFSENPATSRSLSSGVMSHTTESEPADSLTNTKGEDDDDRVSESLAVQHLPFEKTSPVWARVDAMGIFSEMPQRPNMNQFLQHGPELREGMALGLMLSFANLAEIIDRLDVHDDGSGGELMQGLSVLEANGFDVRVLRSRLEALLSRKEPCNDHGGNAMKV